MTRAEKYPETMTFLYHNENPKGRITGDCTVRAIARATGMTWDEVLDGLYEMSKKTKYFVNNKENFGKYLESIGWVKHSQPRNWDNTKYTGADWCHHLSIAVSPDGSMGSVIANIGGHHITCIEPTNHGDGHNCRYKIRDIWDCSRKCIGNYWTKAI